MPYKVLSESMRSMHGGRAKWTPGRKKSVKGDLIPCTNGLHICRDESDLIRWLGPVICECEHSDEYMDAPSKRVCRWVRISEPNPYWNTRTARHFACDCAEYAIEYARDDQRGLLQACIDVVRACADWPEEWDDARAAADAAAQAAAEAAWDAADAAASATVDARAAEADLSAILKTYLGGTNEWCQGRDE